MGITGSMKNRTGRNAALAAVVAALMLATGAGCGKWAQPPSPEPSAPSGNGSLKQVDYSFLCDKYSHAPECESYNNGTKWLIGSKSTSSDLFGMKTGDTSGDCCDSAGRCVTCNEDQNCIKDVTAAKGPWCSPKSEASCGGEYPQFCPGNDGDHSCCRDQDSCAKTFAGGHSYCKADKRACFKRGEPWKTCGSDACCHSGKEVCVQAFVDFCTKKPESCDTVKGETACTGTEKVGNPPVDNVRCCAKGYTCSSGPYPNCVKKKCSPPVDSSQKPLFSLLKEDGEDAESCEFPTPDPSVSPEPDPTPTKTSDAEPTPSPSVSYDTDPTSTGTPSSRKIP